VFSWDPSEGIATRKRALSRSHEGPSGIMDNVKTSVSDRGRASGRPSDGLVRWSMHLAAMLCALCGLAPARGATADEDQASEGHLVDALALRGDEGRSTLR
jgi:hypothetical protein